MVGEIVKCFKGTSINYVAKREGGTICQNTTFTTQREGPFCEIRRRQNLRNFSVVMEEFFDKNPIKILVFKSMKLKMIKKTIFFESGGGTIIQNATQFFGTIFKNTIFAIGTEGPSKNHDFVRHSLWMSPKKNFRYFFQKGAYAD